MHRSTRVNTTAAALAAAATVVPALGQARYEVVDVGRLDSCPDCVLPRVTAVNASGVAVGTTQDESFFPYIRHAFITTPEGLLDLGHVGGGEAEAYGVNDLSQAVGSSLAGSGRWLGFFWEDGVMHDLRSLGGTFTYALDIANNGVIVGQSDNQRDDWQRPVRWLSRDAHPEDLGTFGGEFGVARAVNESGQIVGWAWDGQRDARPFLWTEDDGLLDLGSLGGPTGGATDINELGQVVGSAQIEERDDSGVHLSHAFLWENGQLTDLGVPDNAGQGQDFLGRPALVNTSAAAINNTGQVAINAYPPPVDDHPGAMLWEDGVMTNLNDLLAEPDQWSIISVSDINDEGVIAAAARANDGTYYAVLLVPVGCPADFDGDGAVNTRDVLAFLNTWASGDAGADFNGDGVVNTQDVLAFLNAWAAGCG